MLLHSPLKMRLADLQSPVAAIPEMIAATLRDAPIGPAVRADTRHDRLRRCIEAEAWTDAALTAVEIALPDWHIVRLACDHGEWICALSRHLMLPDWLDDAVEATGEALPLAILAAAIEAQRREAGQEAGSVSDRDWRSSDGRDTDTPCCCDNFG